MYAINSTFMDVYMQQVLATKANGGASAARLERLRAELGALKNKYANPLFQIPMTFAEIAPVGVLVTLVSAAILRNRRAFHVAATRPSQAAFGWASKSLNVSSRSWPVHTVEAPRPQRSPTGLRRRKSGLSTTSIAGQMLALLEVAISGEWRDTLAADRALSSRSGVGSNQSATPTPEKATSTTSITTPNTTLETG